jgi:MFS family permease
LEGSSASVHVLRELPRPARIVLVGDALSAVGTGLTLAFTVVYLHRIRGIGLEAAALAMSGLALAGLVANPLSGSLSDRLGARNALVAGLVVSAAGAGAMTLVRNSAEGIAAAGLIGFGAALVWPAQESLLASLVSKQSRSTVFAVRYATMNAGLATGAFAAAAIVDLSSPSSFVSLYLLDALSFLLFIPILLLGVRGRTTGRSPGDSHLDRPQRAGGYAAILRDGVFVRVWLLTAVLVGAGYAQVNSTLPAFATRPGGISAEGVALANGANMLTVVLAQILVLGLVQGRRRTNALVATCGFFALTWSLTLVAGSLGSGSDAVAGFVLALVAFALGEVLLAPTLPALVNDLASDELRGRYNGVYVLAWTTGFAIGPALGGIALARGDSTTLFLGLVGVCCATAVASRRLARWMPPALDRIRPDETDFGEQPAIAVTVAER